MAIDPDKPFSREEMYLAKAAGEGDTVPDEPWSRKEYYLSKIAEGGGGGYTLPIASSDTLGGVKVGENLSIDSETGILSATGGGGGPTVVQTTGYSTTSVMSQDAATKMIYPDVSYGSRICIGKGNAHANNEGGVALGVDAASIGNYDLAIGGKSGCSGSKSIAIGYESSVSSSSSVALGETSKAQGAGSVALGSYSHATQQGEINIGLGRATASDIRNFGYDQTEYRLLSGLHDPVSPNDAATKGYVDGAIFYINPTEFNSFSSGTVTNVHFYWDSNYTNLATAGDLQAALFDTGKAKFVTVDTSLPDVVIREYFSVISCLVPDSNSLAVGSGMWIRCGNCGFNNKTFFFGTDSADPDQTAFDITVE